MWISKWWIKVTIGVLLIAAGACIVCNSPDKDFAYYLATIGYLFIVFGVIQGIAKYASGSLDELEW